MKGARLPSLDVPDAEKRAYTEADVHSKLFEPDMKALGYPPRTNTQADGDYFLEQRRLAMRRLVSGHERGFYDGLYLVGNSPVVLCEVKSYEQLDTPVKFEAAEKQLQDYARSEDFERPPPFLLLYSGRPERTRFYRLRLMAEGTLLDEADYEELPETWTWERVRSAHVKGEFAEEVVDPKRLLEILLHHLERIEDDLRGPVAHAVNVVSATETPTILTGFGEWLAKHPEARRRMKQLYERKVAELGVSDSRRVAEEMVTQAALNQLNKVFFLNLCEDRNLPGFYRIMREFLPTSRADATATEAAVFLGLLRRKIRDSAGDWRTEDERAYRSLRADLAPDIGHSVIERNNWWELIRVAFDLAGESFPLVYREDAYDYFQTKTDTLAELIYDLSTKSFKALTNRHVGNIYQGLLSSRRQGEAAGARRRQRAKLGAFYTPKGDVDYMVSKLGLTRESRVLDPCMGSGHFLEGIYEELARLYQQEGYDEEQAYREILGKQIFGGDIDTFATSLAAIRMFLLDDHGTRIAPNLFVHDMLLHTPERPASELFSAEALEGRGSEQAGGAERAVADANPEVDSLADIDGIKYDAVVGNPPYGAKKPAYKAPIYSRLYGTSQKDIKDGSRGTGDGDSYAMFIASGIERLREGGRLCLITNDSFRSLTTHAKLRRLILDRCKILEILLTDTKHFEGVSFQFAGMAITTLERCSDDEARASNEMRLIDYIRDPSDFSTPPPEKVSTLRQEEYEALPETPFFVGVPRGVFDAAKGSNRVGDVAAGKVGVQTGEDDRFLAGIDAKFSGLSRTIRGDQLAGSVLDGEREAGIAASKPHWVPFAKGEGFGEYWRPPAVAIDWSIESVEELERRARRGAKESRKAYLRNSDCYFRPGLTYSVISSGRISARLMPEGWIFGHKGSAIFAEDEQTSELFLLGYLNSALATYFMKRIVNTTATADIGYIEKLPYRRPSVAQEAAVVERVERIVEALQHDPESDIAPLRHEIDEQIFDLFEIRSARGEIRRFYETVGRVEASDEEPESEAGSAEPPASAQAASE